MKFRKNLCGPCNNSRSQPFAHAYTMFSEWSNDNMASIYKIDSLDMEAIFSGKDVTAETYNLARYFMKYLGCRIDDSGLQVPNEIVKFCDGGTFMPHGEIASFRDKALNLYIEMSRAASIDVFPPYTLGDIWLDVSGEQPPHQPAPRECHRQPRGDVRLELTAKCEGRPVLSQPQDDIARAQGPSTARAIRTIARLSQGIPSDRLN